MVSEGVDNLPPRYLPPGGLFILEPSYSHVTDATGGQVVLIVHINVTLFPIIPYSTGAVIMVIPAEKTNLINFNPK